jgi:predicted Zn-dependent protease
MAAQQASVFMNQKSRRQMLEEVVTAKPDDAFARYGLAMECITGGEDAKAREHFEKLVAAHPDYVPAYYHYGQLLARLSNVGEARRILSTGVQVAQKAGNMHARDELQAALQELDAAHEQ